MISATGVVRDFMCVCVCVSVHVSRVHRLVLDYFQSAPSPLDYLLRHPALATDTQSEHQQLRVGLAHAGWLALQLVPDLGRQWGTAPYVQLLSHPCTDVRWCAAQALGVLLDMVCALTLHFVI